MARPGPPRKPTALKILQGTRRPDREVPNEVSFTAGIPQCPDHLGTEAKAEWRRIVAELAKVPGLLQVVDRAMLASYCSTWATVVHLESRLQELGGLTFEIVLKTGAEVTRARPEVKMLHEAKLQLRQLAAEFGFSPASRSRVSGSAGDRAPAPEGKLGKYLG